MQIIGAGQGEAVLQRTAVSRALQIRYIVTQRVHIWLPTQLPYLPRALILLSYLRG